MIALDKNIPHAIQVGTRFYTVSRKKTRLLPKVGKDEVILTPAGGKPFLCKWPMRLHSDTQFKIVEDIAL